MPNTVNNFTLLSHCSFFFFFNDTATTEIYTLSLHDALPISVRAASPHRAHACDRGGWIHLSPRPRRRPRRAPHGQPRPTPDAPPHRACASTVRSEEHTSELQSLTNLVCRLLLEKKKYQHLRQ